MQRKFILTGCALLWLSAAAASWSVMTRFARTPGAQAPAPGRLPSTLTQVARADGSGPVLLVALHPQCSCSIATVHEIERVLEKSGARPAVTLLVYRPARLPQHWTEGAALLSAAAPLQARVVEDVDGRIAAGLGARTSGQVLLYSAVGRLLFAGGVTDERGHEGASAAGDLLAAALGSQKAAGATPGVFGCPLFDGSGRVAEKAGGRA